MSADSTHAHFDVQAIAAASDRLVRQNKKFETAPGSLGVQARLSAAVLKTAYLAMIEEVNRGTADDDLRNSLAALAANLILTWATSSGGGRSMPEVIERLDALMRDLYSCIDAGLCDKALGGVET